MKTSILKQISNNEEKPFRVHIIWIDNSLQLLVLQEEHAWEALISEEKITILAKQFNLNPSDYCNNLLDYVKNSPSNIVVSLTKDEFIINRILDNNLKVKYFKCGLQQSSYRQRVEKLLDDYYSESVQLKERLNLVTQEKEEIEKCKTNYEEKLTELIKKKNSDEDELYGKFILILNEKKRRIQHLTELLEAFKKGRPTTNPPVEIKKRKRKIKKIEPDKCQNPEILSESESSESYKTDDDITKNVPKASTSKKEVISETEPSDDDNIVSGEMFAVKQSCSILEDTSPKSSINLPKRIKTDVTNNNLINHPSTSKVIAVNPPIIEETSAEESPTFDLNTQQLLDML